MEENRLYALFQIHRRDIISSKEGLNTVVYAHRRRAIASIALVTIGRVRMRVHIHSQTRGRMHKRREVNGTLENKRRIAHEFHTHSSTLIVLLHTYITIVCVHARVCHAVVQYYRGNISIASFF